MIGLNVFRMLFVVGLCFVLNSMAVLSQEIKAKVTVNTELLSLEAKQYVATLANDLENYINNQKFVVEEWEGEPIPVDINIYFTSGGNNRYRAKMAIVSRRYVDNPQKDLNETVPTLVVTETNWGFEYSFGANLTYNVRRFDYFTSVIDFYMLLVIGFDMDSYEELGGNTAFEKAREILLLGAAQQADGWEVDAEMGSYTKSNFVKELLDPRYYPFRKLIFSYYVDGIDKLNYDKEEGKRAIVEVISQMAKFKRERIVESSVLVQLFFDAHSRTIATLFNGYKNEEFFSNLMYLDPKNSMLYQDAKDGKIK